MANDNPELREDYEEIAQQCNELPCQLLSQCQNTDEVKIILAESACSSKCFRFSGSMKYPRLQLAIEDGQIDFVGHMYCQQTLKQAWYGKLSWKQASNLSKLMHFCMQILMAPIIATIFCYKKTVKDAGIKKDMVGSRVVTIS